MRTQEKIEKERQIETQRREGKIVSGCISICYFHFLILLLHILVYISPLPTLPRVLGLSEGWRVGWIYTRNYKTNQEYPQLTPNTPGQRKYNGSPVVFGSCGYSSFVFLFYLSSILLVIGLCLQNK